MKRRIVNMMLSIVMTVTSIVSSTVSENKTISNSMSSNSMIDNKQVQYIDEITINRNNVQVYYVKTKKDFDRLTHIIENRNSKIIIEVSNGTVIDNNGNGMDICGFYRRYDTEKFSKGDQVQSFLVYNPDTNCIDDIVCRMDTLIE